MFLLRAYACNELKTFWVGYL